MQKWMLIQNDQAIAGDASLYTQWKQNPGSLLWVDIEGAADNADHKLLAERLALPEAEVRDALRDRHPPEFSGEPDFLFLLMKPLDSESHSLDFNTQQMAIFAAQNCVVTRHNKASDYLQSLWQKVISGECKVSSPYHIVALMARRMISRYGKILLNLEERLDTIEDTLMQDLDEAHMQELVGYNTACLLYTSDAADDWLVVFVSVVGGAV